MNKSQNINKSGNEDRYNALEKEKIWQVFWSEKKVYNFDPNSEKEVFSIDTPPPTISGSLHLGHIYSYTHAEIIARHKRMAGYNVRYPFGLDNNGLPTERLAEKERGIRGKDIELKEFVQICLEITEKYKKDYEDLWKSLGLSFDWELEYSTISLEVQANSQKVFKELFNQGLIYRKESPVLYCCECETSIAQAEIDDKEFESVFYNLIFHLENGEELVISTTRPEFLPACVAVFVNPKDVKNKKLIGQKVITPLGRKVPILADDKVAIDKGTGVVMCCTYGDETDVYWVKKHGLSEIKLLKKGGRFNSVKDFPELENKTIFHARKFIVEKLKMDGAIKGESPIVHVVGAHERCGKPIEFISTSQWFIKILDIKEELLKFGGEVNWHPKFMVKRYNEWVKGLKWDWCISRERFFGIPIPIFECADCRKIFSPEVKYPIDPRTMNLNIICPFCRSKKLIPEKNVLDTWFTSSLTPQINNNSSLNGKLKGKMLPMSVRPQAHDIIRTWAFYTIVMSYYRQKSIPWRDIMISGHILLRSGEKISKKAGGGKIQPQELITTHSADPIRYAMCGSSLGKDGFFDEKEVDKGKKLVNKLYNAGKLVLMLLGDFKPNNNLSDLTLLDQWILIRSQKTAQKMADEFNRYEFGNARKIFEEFFWPDFCDNYLEIAKVRLSDLNKNLSAEINYSTKQALYESFLNILKMASPFVPHITEEIFHSDFKIIEDLFILQSEVRNGYYFKNEKYESIHQGTWPVLDKNFGKEQDEAVNLMLQVVSEIRKYKTSNRLTLRSQIGDMLIETDKQNEVLLKPFLNDVQLVSHAQRIHFLSEENVKFANYIKIKI